MEYSIREKYIEGMDLSKIHPSSFDVNFIYEAIKYDINNLVHLDSHMDLDSYFYLFRNLENNDEGVFRELFLRNAKILPNFRLAIIEAMDLIKSESKNNKSDSTIIQYMIKKICLNTVNDWDNPIGFIFDSYDFVKQLAHNQNLDYILVHRISKYLISNRQRHAIGIYPKSYLGIDEKKLKSYELEVDSYIIAIKKHKNYSIAKCILESMKDIKND